MADKRVLNVFAPQSPASRTLSQSRLLYRGELGACTRNSTVPSMVMAVASAAKMELLSGNLLDRRLQVVSPLRK